MRSRSQGRRRSVDRGTCGPGIEPRKRIPSGCRRCKGKRKAPSGASISRDALGPCAVTDPVHVRKHLAREPGESLSAQSSGLHREVPGRTPMMNGQGRSDRPAVPTSSPNKAGRPVAEGTEGTGQTARPRWERMRRLLAHWLPPARVCHPYHLRRLGVIT